ncbi:MAG: protein-L-isoaspartate(D-aspartate) O-methyltransferase [Kofleriaceae bacterium]|nr:protein-L-isoaspartate(D-aspartate) O-methyltransferase [Kofleriaceae bacterium]
MVDRTIVARGITDARVITAMRLTPREQFVPPSIRDQAYDDRPLPIGYDKTISQAYIVALMTEMAKVKPGDRVLEIGTGSGYQAAVLAVMGAKVYTIEIDEPLAARTRDVLKLAGFGRVSLKLGDGYFGWADAAPFDEIIVTCAVPDRPPPALVAQLKVGGRMVVPLGTDDQHLEVITKTSDGISRERLIDVRFGPMIGEVEK